MRLNVHILGVNTLKNDLDQYMFRKRKGLFNVVAESTRSIESSAKQMAPVDLGDLRGEIGHIVKQTDKSIIGEILSAASYSAYVEFGARPHRPPARALAGWSARHNVPLGAVLNKIERDGTPAQPYMLPAAMKEKPKFVRKVKSVMSTI